MGACWEYTSFNGSPGDRTTSTLNRLGAACWELVSVAPLGGGVLYFQFKRALAPTPGQAKLWEYRDFGANPARVNDTANEMARDGWDMAAIAPADGTGRSLYCLLRRPRSTASSAQA